MTAVTITLRPGTSILHGVTGAKREYVYKALEPYTSFRVPGAWFSTAYRSGCWDGRIRLVRRIRGGGLTFPTGFVHVVAKVLSNKGLQVRVTDNRPQKRVISMGMSTWAGPELRPYQADAVRAMHSANVGGIVVMPVRSGKTITAARFVYESQERAIFVVTSDLLLRQALHEFCRCLPDAEITAVGAGEKSIHGDVVIATIQTLYANSNSEWMRRAKNAFSVAIFDEVHHLDSSGPAWRDVSLSLASRRKFGLSATVDTSPGRKHDPETVWLHGICGDIIYHRTVGDAIRDGYLAPLDVVFMEYKAEYTTEPWDRTSYRRLIVECEPRNRRIVEEVASDVEKGRTVLVDCSRVGHCYILRDMVSRKIGPDRVAVVVGSTKRAERDEIMTKMANKDLPVLIGTILGEGIDIPHLDVVINAEGGKSGTAIMQRLRNMTMVAGKHKAITKEPLDVHHPKLKQQTRERYKFYKTESAFRIRLSTA